MSPSALTTYFWPRALRLELTGDPLRASYAQHVDLFGQSRWYKFAIQPNSTVVVLVTGMPPTVQLPTNYDLVLFKDIAAAYEDLVSADDLVRITAEYAPAAFSPSAYSPAAFSPAAFSPAAFSPAAFSPAAFSPAAFSPAAFSPAAFSPAAFSPAAFSPAAFSPDAFSPAAFSPAAFSPAAFSPAAFSPAAFSSAQTRSVIGISAFGGTSAEGLMLNTWNNTGDFYIRVRGRRGQFDRQTPYRVQIIVYPGGCDGLDPNLTASTLAASGPDYETLILTDYDRLPGDQAVLQTRLGELATAVTGTVVDVGEDARVASLNSDADTYYDCPYAKNLVAAEIRSLVAKYKALNAGLKYVVIIGGDNVIPFFRHPDTAMLGPESDYVPPVLGTTPSQSSLRLNYVLSQDAYGAPFDLSR